MLFVKVVLLTLLGFSIKAFATSFACKGILPDGRRVGVEGNWDAAGPIVMGSTLLSISNRAGRYTEPPTLREVELKATSNVMTLSSKEADGEPLRIDYFPRTKEGVTSILVNNVYANESHCEFKADR